MTGRGGVTTTEVEIFGSVYPVRGQHDAEYLQGLASRVDSLMREIAAHVATVDNTRIAILAALNLADELCRRQKEQEGEQTEIADKIAELASKLDTALEHSSR